jgi:hypothetical protein
MSSPMAARPDVGQLLQLLVDEFSQRVRDYLSPEQMQQVLTRNLSGSPSVCATHDFCDANELMAQAFVLVMGREPEPSSSLDAELWNCAWSIAKNANFARPLRLVVWDDGESSAFAYIIRRKVIFDPRRDHQTNAEVDPIQFYRLRAAEVAALDSAKHFLMLTRAH